MAERTRTPAEILTDARGAREAAERNLNDSRAGLELLDEHADLFDPDKAALARSILADAVAIATENVEQLADVERRMAQLQEEDHA